MLLPNPSWTWVFDSSEDVLVLLEAGAQRLKTTFSGKYLVPDAKAELAFSVEHCEDFIAWLEQLDSYELWSEQQLFEIVIHAIVAKHYHVPVMPKNWLFEPQNNQYPIRECDLVWATSAKQRYQFLVVSTDKKVSVVMLLDQQLVTDSKTYQQFSVLKLANQLLSLER